MAKLDTSLDWAVVEAELPRGWEDLAQKHSLAATQAEHLGTKVENVRDVLRLVLHLVATGESLRATAARAAVLGVLAVSHVALHKWMKKLGPFLAEMLQQMIGAAAFAPERWGGFHVIAADATTVQRPGSKGTTARVHYALRLADLSPRHIEVTDEHGGETARRFMAEPGELWLLDRGYSNSPGIRWLRKRGAHVLVRLNRGSLPVFDRNGNVLDVLALMREKLGTPGNARHMAVMVGPPGERVFGRLCWVRLPDEKATQARRRAMRDSDGELDPTTLEMAEYVAVFTTVMRELTKEDILELYRARWQIELDFKRAKSIRDLDRLPNFRADTIHTWICAKMLLQTIAMRIASQADEFPPCERFKLLGEASAARPMPSGEEVAASRNRRTLVRCAIGLGVSTRRHSSHRAAQPASVP